MVGVRVCVCGVSGPWSCEFTDLRARAKVVDTTDYPPGWPHKHDRGEGYVQFWTERLSAAIVTADARRCLRRLPGLQLQATQAAARRAAAVTARRAHDARAADAAAYCKYM